MDFVTSRFRAAKRIAARSRAIDKASHTGHLSRRYHGSRFRAVDRRKRCSPAVIVRPTLVSAYRHLTLFFSDDKARLDRSQAKYLLRDLERAVKEVLPTAPSRGEILSSRTGSEVKRIADEIKQCRLVQKQKQKRTEHEQVEKKKKSKPQPQPVVSRSEPAQSATPTPHRLYPIARIQSVSPVAADKDGTVRLSLSHDFPPGRVVLVEQRLFGGDLSTPRTLLIREPRHFGRVMLLGKDEAALMADWDKTVVVCTPVCFGHAEPEWVLQRQADAAFAGMVKTKLNVPLS